MTSLERDTERVAGVAASEGSVGAVFAALLRLMRTYPGLLALSIATGVASAALALAPHLAVAYAVVELLGTMPDWRNILVAGLAAAAAVVLRHALFGVSTASSHIVAFSCLYDLRIAIAERLARVPLGFFDGRSKGQIRSTLLTDIDSLEDGIAHLVPETSAAVVTPVVAFAIMLLIDWRLGILALLPTVLGIALMGRLMAQSETATRRHFALLARLNEAATEMADGLTTVRAFNQDGQAVRRAKSVFRDEVRLSDEWIRAAVVPGTTAQVILSSHLLFVGPAGLLMVAGGLIPFSTLAAFLFVAAGMNDLFAAIQGIAHRVGRQAQILERIEALRRAELLAEPSPGKAISDSSVNFDRVSFSYGTRCVIDDVSFSVAPGKSVALVGPSGSGKSTIAKLVARFHDAASGTVSIGGTRVQDCASDRLHAHIGIVFQDVFLFAGTIAENIRLGRIDATDEEVRAAAKAARADVFIDRLPQGFRTRVGERGYGLSGGERQRISIARAILKNAPILILDEATSFADAENEALVQEAVAEAARGKTLIVIAHRLYTITHVDEIVVLDRGRIAERGSHEALLGLGGLYARMWRAQEKTRHLAHGPREAAQ